MVNNRLANFINQALVAIKLITYSIIAIVGFYHLITKETSHINWQKPLSDGNPDFTAYSTAILLVNTNIFFDKSFMICTQIFSNFFFI